MTSWTNLARGRKLVVLWAGAFTALVAAIFSLTQVLTATEAFHPATRGYVRDEIAKTISPITAGQVDNQIETVEVRRSQVEKEQFELDLLLRNVTTPVPDNVRPLLEVRKRVLDDDRKNLDYRLDQLQRTRSGRRP